MSDLKEGDRVYIHYVDVDGICGSGNIITEGVVRAIINGMVTVRYKDPDLFFETEREFYPHDLNKLENQ